MTTELRDRLVINALLIVIVASIMILILPGSVAFPLIALSIFTGFAIGWFHL